MRFNLFPEDSGGPQFASVGRPYCSVPAAALGSEGIRGTWCMRYLLIMLEHFAKSIGPGEQWILKPIAPTFDCLLRGESLLYQDAANHISVNAQVFKGESQHGLPCRKNRLQLPTWSRVLHKPTIRLSLFRSCRA